MNPVITELPKVEVMVGNELIKEEMEKIYGSILNTLKKYLHNSAIQLTITVSEYHENMKIMTRSEHFEELSKQNPSVEKLRAAFNLELA
jgi:DNA polymerase-3 subunit gamma/tau